MPSLSLNGALPAVEEEEVEEYSEVAEYEAEVKAALQDKLRILSDNDAHLHRLLLFREFSAEVNEMGEWETKWSCFDEEDLCRIGEEIDSCRAIAQTLLDGVRDNYGVDWLAWLEKHRILQRRAHLLDRAVSEGYLDPESDIFSFYVKKQETLSAMI